MSDALLRCEQIHKSYMLGRTVLPVLRGVDLDLRAGEFIAVTGASGSGKSTLLHVMSGLDVPQHGQVFYQGEPLFEPESVRRIPVGRDSTFADAARSAFLPQSLPEPRHLCRADMTARPKGRGSEAVPAHQAVGRGDVLESRRNDLLNKAFGFVFQFYHLLPEFDVLENVLLPQMVGRSIGGWLAGRTTGTARAHELLARVGLRERLHHRPNELSGGERQRVAIARALMNDPAVLMADEPTGNLDGKTGRDIFSLLKGLNRGGQTLVMVTHDRDLAAEADTIVNLADGRVAGVVRRSDARVR
jgi:ABC-type lipoprotein export system ATPase subunit